MHNYENIVLKDSHNYMYNIIMHNYENIVLKVHIII